MFNMLSLYRNLEPVKSVEPVEQVKLKVEDQPQCPDCNNIYEYWKHKHIGPTTQVEPTTNLNNWYSR